MPRQASRAACREPAHANGHNLDRPNRCPATRAGRPRSGSAPLPTGRPRRGGHASSTPKCPWPPAKLPPRGRFAGRTLRMSGIRQPGPGVREHRWLTRRMHASERDSLGRHHRGHKSGRHARHRQSRRCLRRRSVGARDHEQLHPPDDVPQLGQVDEPGAAGSSGSGIAGRPAQDVVDELRHVLSRARGRCMGLVRRESAQELLGAREHGFEVGDGGIVVCMRGSLKGTPRRGGSHSAVPPALLPGAARGLAATWPRR